MGIACVIALTPSPSQSDSDDASSTRSPRSTEGLRSTTSFDIESLNGARWRASLAVAVSFRADADRRPLLLPSRTVRLRADGR
jgi:hypothetical protein